MRSMGLRMKSQVWSFKLANLFGKFEKTAIGKVMNLLIFMRDVMFFREI